MFPSAPTLTVDLAALTRNYQRLQKMLGSTACGAVVKANGYGLGAPQVATALTAAGCQTFFVATLEEAIELRVASCELREDRNYPPLGGDKLATRNSQPATHIYVFHGPRAGEEKDFVHHQLRPVLNTPAHIELWSHTGAPAALQLDTGMSRLGLSEAETKTLAANPALFKKAGITLIMSHLACADVEGHSKNDEQRTRFAILAATLPSTALSLTNSAGIFLGPGFHFNLARPGCAIYGINPIPYAPSPVEQVVGLSAPILQLRTLDRDAVIGYEATCTRPKGTRVAVVELGYADGYFRYLSNKGIGFIAGHEVPVIGRVSMDMMMLDISHVPEALLTENTRVDFIHPGFTIDDFARRADTIGYDLLTRLGRRVHRVYI